MAEDELAEFMARRPTGAICVVDAHQRLLAVPARVAAFDHMTIDVVVNGMDGDAAHHAKTDACVVADTFTTYQDIRGVIAQGAAIWPPGPDRVTTLAIRRTLTFSFANA